MDPVRSESGSERMSLENMIAVGLVGWMIVGLVMMGLGIW